MVTKNVSPALHDALDALDPREFPRLTHLVCNGCSLTELDLSRSAELEQLHCCGNRLEMLDVSACAPSFYLDCTDNPELHTVYRDAGQTLDGQFPPQTEVKIK